MTLTLLWQRPSIGLISLIGPIAPAPPRPQALCSVRRPAGRRFPSIGLIGLIGPIGLINNC